eukprot:5657483-Prymnesium_polylepis.1
MGGRACRASRQVAARRRGDVPDPIWRPLARGPASGGHAACGSMRSPTCARAGVWARAKTHRRWVHLWS